MHLRVTCRWGRFSDSCSRKRRGRGEAREEKGAAFPLLCSAAQNSNLFSFLVRSAPSFDLTLPKDSTFVCFRAPSIASRWRFRGLFLYCLNHALERCVCCTLICVWICLALALPPQKRTILVLVLRFSEDGLLGRVDQRRVDGHLFSYRGLLAIRRNVSAVAAVGPVPAAHKERGGAEEFGASVLRD